MKEKISIQLIKYKANNTIQGSMNYRVIPEFIKYMKKKCKKNNPGNVPQAIFQNNDSIDNETE